MPSHGLCDAVFFWGSLCGTLAIVARTVLPRVYSSKLNTRVGAKSTNFGPERMDRELLIFAHGHNCGTDVARGICRRDVYGCRYWVEMEVAVLWTNIDGPSPGGNLMMPPVRPPDSQWSQVMLKLISCSVFAREMKGRVCCHRKRDLCG